jgi:H+/Cl- antiporter ClcA
LNTDFFKTVSRRKIVLRARKFVDLSVSSIKNEQLKKNLLQAIPFWIASLITGLTAVFYAQVFKKTEELSMLIFHYHAWLLFIISPVCFFLARFIVRQFAPYSRGSGIPQTMAAIEIASAQNDNKTNKLLGLRIIIIKILSSLLMAFGGGAVGREGPIIHIAGSIFRKINVMLPKHWPKISRKNMILTGAAAGLAAAFNTPLGGIVFAVEELSKTQLKYFKSAIFTAVIIAGLTAQGILGSYLYLGFPLVINLSDYILFGVMLVALIAGAAGSGMGRLIWSIFRWKATFKKNYHHVIYLTIGSLIIVSLAYFVNENAMGSGKSLMVSTLFTDEKYSEWYMPLLRVITPVLSFTTGASGGIFAPSLSGGGVIGSTISGWLSLSPSDTNLMILAGMVAFLTGVTRAPFTSAVLVLEMTDRNNLVLHLMLAGIVATFAARLISKESLYDRLKIQYLSEIEAEGDDDNPSITKAIKKRFRWRNKKKQ